MDRSELTNEDNCKIYGGKKRLLSIQKRSPCKLGVFEISLSFFAYSGGLLATSSPNSVQFRPWIRLYLISSSAYHAVFAAFDKMFRKADRDACLHL